MSQTNNQNRTAQQGQQDRDQKSKQDSHKQQSQDSGRNRDAGQTKSNPGASRQQGDSDKGPRDQS